MKLGNGRDLLFVWQEEKKKKKVEGRLAQYRSVTLTGAFVAESNESSNLCTELK